MNWRVQQKPHTFTGFTIVELLIVIVVIAILAAISIVAFNGVQDRAKATKIKADLNQISKATLSARVLAEQPLGQITGSWYTAKSCLDKPSGTDLAALPRTDACWVDYLAAMEKISQLSGINISNMVDPWGRPYAIDENEGRNSTEFCIQDRLRTFRYPHVQSSPDSTYSYLVPNFYTECP